jgi:hypothetical protein
MTRYALAFIPLLLSAPSGARDRTYILRGDGYMDPVGPGSRVPVREIRLRLREDGAFSASIDARGERIDVRGTWHRRGKSNVDRLSIGDAFGARADGSGTLQFNRRGSEQPVRLFLEGRTRRGEFRVEMRDDGNRGRGDDRNDGDPMELGRGTRLFRGIDATTTGDGMLRMSGVRDGRFAVMRARLATSREAVIDIDRGTRGTVRGEITDVSGYTATLRVREIMGRDASGTIEISMHREHEIKRVRGSGTGAKGSWQLDFDGPNSGRSTDDYGGWDVGGWGRERIPLPDRRAREFAIRGRGTLTQDVGPTIVLDRLRILLQHNHDAVVTLEGPGPSVRLEGSWSEGRFGDVVIELGRVNEMHARGRVEMRVLAGSLEYFRGAGQTNLGRFDLHFTGR